MPLGGDSPTAAPLGGGLRPLAAVCAPRRQYDLGLAPLSGGSLGTAERLVGSNLYAEALSAIFL